ncbi:MAG: DUF3127 domain-containing protein [Bacteroidota bacterium]|nr:DUF3127 domain-containing protein [Bacteroidota bacterium]
MSLEIEGKVIKILPEQTGQGRNGVWVKQDFVIETEGDYPKKICFSSWGDKAEIVKKLTPGSNVKVTFSPESREYNERWYTDLRAYRIEGVSNDGFVPDSDVSYDTDSSTVAPQPEDDLPF